MASGFKNVGVGKGIFTDDGACKLILQGDGRLHMIVSGTDMGQGFRTAMTQVAAETLDMEIENIFITNGDTELTIPTGESVSERQTLCGGRAVYEACVKLKQDLDSRPWQPGEERRAEYYYACDPCFAIGDFEGAKKRGAKYRNFPAYAYATQAAIVEVDRETGEGRVPSACASIRSRRLRRWFSRRSAPENATCRPWSSRSKSWKNDKNRALPTRSALSLSAKRSFATAFRQLIYEKHIPSGTFAATCRPPWKTAR